MRSYRVKNEVLILDSISSLTNRDPLITVWSSQPVSASPTVVATEVAVTLAGAVEKSQGPPFSVIPPGVRVLGPVAPVVCSD